MMNHTVGTAQVGDTIQVTDRKSGFSGCVLTLLAIERGWYLCENSYGRESRAFDGKYRTFIRVRSVAFYRKAWNVAEQGLPGDLGTMTHLRGGI
jgi:hypothetical protein